MQKLKDLGQTLTKQQQQQILGGIAKNCNSCSVPGYCDPDLPMCPSCGGRTCYN
ncbi:hypothetical protein [Undibacterium flavidum]|uniref:Bacteriocin-like protein n=1 Tax=Undibacterium flavidum TaxID=2762297 RepID=A0ABR6Y9B5_9BURK|nr:hypothetical protein [Undibacterium flavidum]MBC3873213.1 hypothetical protein [Undibacterium flavidum]